MITLNHKFNSVLDLYFTDCLHLKQLRPATIQSYREFFHGFRALMPEIETLNDLKNSTLNVYLQRVAHKNNGKVKPSTFRSYYDRLMVFYNWLENNEYVEPKTLTKPKSVPKRPIYDDIKALSNSDISTIITSIAQNGINDEFRYARDILILHLLLYTGVRKGELIALNVSDIDWQKKTLHISGQTSKSKRSRSIPLHPQLFQSLRMYLAERKSKNVTCSTLLVSQRTYHPFTKAGLKHWVRRYNTLSGVSFHLHQFRHSFACTLAKQNADISSIKKLLGHQSSTTTERYLRSITTESARSFVENMQY